MKIEEGSTIKFPTLDALVKRAEKGCIHLEMRNELIHVEDNNIKLAKPTLNLADLGKSWNVVCVCHKTSLVSLSDGGDYYIEELEAILDKPLELVEPTTVKEVCYAGQRYEFRDNNTLAMNGMSLNQPQAQKLFENLANLLGYKLED